jgi:hypothetical protein
VVLKPTVEWELADSGPGVPGLVFIEGRARHGLRRPARVLYYGYEPSGLFCSMKCGYRFAVQSLTEGSGDSP